MTREQVIKGLECCKEGYCPACPYYYETKEGACQMHDDAIALLKEQPELVHCSECVHCAKSEYAGFWHCEAWDEDVSMDMWNPEEYYCREGERREL